MTVLTDVFAAMGRADTDAALTAVREIFNETGGVPDDPMIVAGRVGEAQVARWCEAFGLDSGEVLSVANEQGERQADAVLSVAPGMFLFRSLFAQVIASGVLTGMRAGLMVADHQSRAGG